MDKVDMTDVQQRGAIAGVVAAAAMAVAGFLDMALTGQRTNDLRLLGGLVPGGRRLWPVFGLSMHLFNGAILGRLFGYLHYGLPGPLWVRGVIFALIENLILWPIILLTDRIHPHIKTGELERYNRPGPAVTQITRHIVYGAVLGLMYDRFTPRIRR